MPSIYVLDYDTDIAYVLCHWFTKHGFISKSFEEPEQLFNQLATNPSDLVILDCLTGDVDSTVDICHTLQDVLHYQGKIVLTATGKLSEKIQHVCDAVTCIAKPFDLSEVLDTVKSLFNNSIPNKE